MVMIYVFFAVRTERFEMLIKLVLPKRFKIKFNIPYTLSQLVYQNRPSIQRYNLKANICI
jgi:hypothetical protein